MRQLNIRVTDQEFTALADLAQRQGVELSEFARSALREKLPPKVQRELPVVRRGRPPKTAVK